MDVRRAKRHKGKLKLYVDWLTNKTIFGEIVKAVEMCNGLGGAVRLLRAKSDVYARLTRSTLSGYFAKINGRWRLTDHARVSSLIGL